MYGWRVASKYKSVDALIKVDRNLRIQLYNLQKENMIGNVYFVNLIKLYLFLYDFFFEQVAAPPIAYLYTTTAHTYMSIKLMLLVFFIGMLVIFLLLYLHSIVKKSSAPQNSPPRNYIINMCSVVILLQLNNTILLVIWQKYMRIIFLLILIKQWRLWRWMYVYRSIER